MGVLTCGGVSGVAPFERGRTDAKETRTETGSVAAAELDLNRVATVGWVRFLGVARLDVRRLHALEAGSCGTSQGWRVFPVAGEFVL